MPGNQVEQAFKNLAAAAEAVEARHVSMVVKLVAIDHLVDQVGPNDGPGALVALKKIRALLKRE